MMHLSGHKFQRLYPTLPLLWGSILVSTLTAAPEPESTALAASLNARDWKAVAALLAQIDDAHGRAEMQILKGHACLALNRIDEGLGLFISGGRPLGLDAWCAWTTAFRSANPTSPVALCLFGDACARKKQWAEAARAFDAALRISPIDAQALTYRGTCRALNGDLNGALQDFATAARAAPALAEPWLDRGVMYIQNSTAARGALAAVDHALLLAPDCELAQLARACALKGLGRYTDARDCLLRCKSNALHPFAAFDSVQVAMATVTAQQVSLGAFSNAPGTSITQTLSIKDQAIAINQQAQQEFAAQRQQIQSAGGNWLFGETMRSLGQMVGVGAEVAPNPVAQMGLRGSGVILEAAGATVTDQARESMNLATARAQATQESALHELSELKGQTASQSPSTPGGASLNLSAAFVDKGPWGCLCPPCTGYTSAPIAAHLPASN